MKIINHKKIIISLAAFCIFYNIYSCAAIRAPSGGLKDIIPPVLLYSLPKSGSVNFKGENIELFFSEYLSEKSIDNSITILPDINNLYKIKYKGDKIIIEFLDSLEDNQTYILSINRDLKDEHNVPIDEGTQLAFSTGHKIDYGIISGRIHHSSVASVHLWNIGDSSDQVYFWKRPPDYKIDASDNGEYKFNYLSPGDYKVMGFDKKASTNLIDPDNTVYGIPFLEKITIDTIKKVLDHIDIIVPNNPRMTRLIKGEWVSNRWGKLTFNSPINNYIDDISVAIKVDSIIYIGETFIDNNEKNILHFFINDTISKGEKTLINIKPVIEKTYAIIDSASITARVPFEQDTTFLTIESELQKNILEIEENKIVPLNLSFSRLMTADVFDTTDFLFKDSIKIDIDNNWISPKYFQIMPKTNWSPNSDYSLMFLKEKISLFNKYEKSIKDSLLVIKFSTSRFKKFGNIEGKINKSKINSIIVRLISFENEELFYDANINSDSSFKITQVPEGQYYLMVFYDDDKNKNFSSGHVMPYLSSEWFMFLSDTLTIRSNWDMEISDINLEK